MSSRPGRTLSRRALLGVGLGLAGSALLAACAPPPAQTEATAAAKTGAAPAAPAAKPAEAAKPAADAAKPAAAPPAGATEMVFHCRQGDLANHFVEYAKRWTDKNPTTPIRMETMVAT